MRSKIPNPKTMRSDEKRVPSGGPINDPILVHDAFILLGAPHIEREEFGRMYHGPLTATLAFISEHMKGRQGVALARHRIHRIREARLKSHLKQPDDIARPATDKTTSILSGAKRNVEMLRKQLDDRQLELEETQGALEKLRQDLDEKRRTKLLLTVLEQKEKIRVKRFQEIVKLINDLRKAVSEVEVQAPLPNYIKSSDRTAQVSMAKTRPPRVSHTPNALMNLHAHHLRLSRLVRSENVSESELFAWLRTIIARQTGKPATDPNTGMILDEFISVARARAKRRQRFQNYNLTPVSELELEKKHVTNQEKERELQNVSDLTVALGFLCEHSISSVNVFIEKLSPALRASLEEEAPLTNGYIDVLRCIITAAPNRTSDETRFVQRVKEICNLRGRIVPSEIVAWVEATVRKCHRQALFLEALAVLQSSPPTEGQETLIASYATNAKNAQGRTTKLLTRKVDKAEMGYSLTKDIQNLVQETKMIVG